MVRGFGTVCGDKKRLFQTTLVLHIFFSEEFGDGTRRLNDVRSNVVISLGGLFVDEYIFGIGDSDVKTTLIDTTIGAVIHADFRVV